MDGLKSVAILQTILQSPYIHFKTLKFSAILMTFFNNTIYGNMLIKSIGAML